MFLATTALEEFWDKSQKIVFLGEWCKLYDRKDVWSKLVHETLPYHWDNRQKLYSDYVYLNNLYEEILIEVSKNLNKIHGVNHSVRYWRIIVGWWLRVFVEVLYDRYESIKVAEKHGKLENTYVSRFEPGSWTPNDSDEFSSLYANDGYNYYIYSKIIGFCNRTTYTVVDAQGFIKKPRIFPKSNIPSFLLNSRNLKSLLKFLKKKVMKNWDMIIPSSLNRVVFVSSYFSLKDQFLLQLRLRQLPYFGQLLDFEVPGFDFDSDRRKKLILDLDGNEFKKLLAAILPDQFPLNYLEGYEAIKQIALASYPKNPKVIFTAVASFNYEPFKFWSAHCCSQGSKLVHTQHGGARGILLFGGDEEYEYKISDIYYSWGWENKERRNIKAMPSPMLASRKNLKGFSKGRMLMALCAMPRYSYRMYSVIVAASGYNAYLEDQFRFIEGLSENAKKLLLVRLYMHDLGYSQEKRFEDRVPDVECYRGNKSMYEQLQHSRLFIGTYCGTTYLETFAANFPTVLFWNPNHWELRETAKPYFDELRRVGILHDTPESAAAKVNEIYEYPMDWWQQTEVQRVKNELCEKFARTSKNWVNEWMKELNTVIATEYK